MPQPQISKFGFRELVRLPCAWCEGPMYLVWVEPGKPGRDSRVYECPRCGNVENNSTGSEVSRTPLHMPY
jgi:hypothetical protein